MSTWASGIVAALLALGACTRSPESTARPVEPTRPAYVTIAIFADGTIEIDGTIVQRSEIEHRFRTLAASGTNVIITSMPVTGYGDIAWVFAAAERTGLSTKMGIIGGT